MKPNSAIGFPAVTISYVFYDVFQNLNKNAEALVLHSIAWQRETFGKEQANGYS